MAVINFENTANNIKRMEGEIMTTPVKASLITVPTIVVPTETDWEEKDYLDMLNQSWDTARVSGGAYDRYANLTVLTRHWDWENRRDVTAYGHKVAEGMKDLNQVRVLCDHNWNVFESPLYDDYSDVDGWKSIRRDDNNELLHVAKGKYTCIQMDEFYRFAQEMVNLGFNCRNGGAFNDGQMVFLSMKADNYTVCGEPFTNYAVLSNSFNGMKPFAMYFTDVRIYCYNTYMCGTQAKNAVFSIRHTSKAEERIDMAIEAMKAKNAHQIEFKQAMERLAMKPITDADVWELTKRAFPVKKGDKVRALKNTLDARNEFMYRYLNAPDLQEHQGTQYGVLGASTDYADHRDRKDTKNAEANQFRDMLGRPTFGAWMYNQLSTL